MRNNKFIEILTGIVVILVFVLTGFKIIDPDLGWHLRMGELIVKSGIPATDPFSYTMPSYPFVDYEWLTNVIWFVTFEKLGLLGWSIIYGILAVVSMVIATPKLGKKYVWLVALLGWSTLLFRFGVRAQVVNWLFWAILVRLIFDNDFWLKYWKFYPWLMLLWANLHGSYPLGVVAMAIFLALRDLQNKNWRIKDWKVWFVGAIFTLVNPYGVRNWEEVLLVMKQSSLLRSSVQEWTPFYNVVDFGLVIGLVMVMIAAIRSIYKWPWWQIGLSVWMMWWGVSGLRYGPLFMIWAAPIISLFWQEFEKIIGDDPIKKNRFEIIMKVMLWMVGGVFVITAMINIKKSLDYKVEGVYPVGAINYLKTNGVKGNLFSEYGWGGYLIWQLKGEKLFIDGRMSCFSWQPPAGESGHAFEEYLSMLKDETVMKKALEKYGVETVLWPDEDYFENRNIDGRINNWLKKWIKIFDKDFDNKIILQRFSDWGWEEVYRDQNAVVLVRPDDRR